MKNLSRFCFVICVLLCVTWGCEKRELWLDVVNEPTVTSLRATFEEDQALFLAKTDPPEYTLRQGLDRTIHWDRAYQSDEGYYFVPLTLSLKLESNERFQNGRKVYPYKTVLMIDPTKDEGRYTMLTFVGKGSVAAEFTGMMLFEDYFLGNVKYTSYQDGVTVHFRNGNIEGSDLKMFQASGGGGCGWIEVGEICVGDMDGSGAPDSCESRYEYACNGDAPIDFEDAFDGGGGDENNGGDGGGGYNGPPSTPENKQNDECEGVTKANNLKSFDGLQDTINKIVNSSTEIGHHFYLSDKADVNTMYIGSPRTSGSTSNWPGWYTWNPTNGYTIGSIHNHPSNPAPSPSDAMAGVNISDMKALHPNDADFVTKNNITVVVTNSYIYTITIKDAAAFETYQNEFNPNKNVDYSNYALEYESLINPNASLQEMGEYALLKMYGDAINLTKRNKSGAGNASELKLNESNQKVVLNDPCN